MSVATINAYLNGLKDQAEACLEKGNHAGAAYMAMICGMWTHTAHRPITSPFRNENNIDFIYGYRASEDAMRMNTVLAKRFQKFEEERAKKLAEAKKK